MIRLLALAAVAALLAACGQPATIISYKQVGACNGFAYTDQFGDSWTASAGPDQAYVIFAVEKIDNSQRTTPFTIDPAKLYVQTVVKDFFDPTLQLYAHKLGPFALIKTPVAPGGVILFSPFAYGALVVQTGASDESEANKTNYQLQYNADASDPPIIMMKNPPTSWPDTQNCDDIALK